MAEFTASLFPSLRWLLARSRAFFSLSLNEPRHDLGKTLAREMSQVKKTRGGDGRRREMGAETSFRGEGEVEVSWLSVGDSEGCDRRGGIPFITPLSLKEAVIVQLTEP